MSDSYNTQGLDFVSTNLTTPQIALPDLDAEPASLGRARDPSDFALSPSDRPSTRFSFPRSLILTVWNCRGLISKAPEIYHVMDETKCDILVLTETFRFPGCPWPRDLPPCIGESTANPVPSSTRNSAGVAVLVNPTSVISGRIGYYSLIEADNLFGSKVLLKINNFFLFAAYTAPSSDGSELLRSYTQHALNLSVNREPLVFCGDFNAHSTLWGSIATNDRGHLVHDLLTGGFFRAETGPEATRPSSRVDSVVSEGSIIDHILGSHVDLCLAQCHSSIAQTSDHRPISVTVVPVASRVAHSTKYWRLNLRALSDPVARQRYVAEVARKVDPLFDELAALSSHLDCTAPIEARRAIVDSMEFAFVTCLTTAAENTLGMKSVPLVAGSRTNRRQLSDEYCEVRSDLKLIFTDLKRHRSLPATHPRIADLLERRELTKARLNDLRLRDNRRSFQNYASSASNLPPQVLLKRISAMRRRRTAAGASLSSTSVALAAYKRHFSRQFTNPYLVNPGPVILPVCSPEQRVEHCRDTFTETRVLDCINRSPSHKAPGISSLSSDLLKPVSDLVTPILTAIFQTYFSFSVVPSSWTRALICPVPKKGDLSQISNYRPISLTEVTRKIFEMVILLSTQDSLTLSREQGGFRLNRSTLDQVECLDRLIKQARLSHRRLPHLAFLDIKAAYDSVPRHVLWSRCIELKLHSITIASLMALFDHNSGQLVVGQHRSPPFSQPAGVLQGSVLSPLLYSIYLDPLVESLRAHGEGIMLPIGGRSMNCLLYADDIALIATSPQALDSLLEIAEADSISRGYRFSPSKCVVISPLRPPGSHSLYGQALVPATHFNYLGVEFSSLGIDESRHSSNRIRKAETATFFLKSIGMNIHGFDPLVCLRLYKAFIRPGLEYGLPLMGTVSSTLEKLRLCQKRAVCSILGVDPNSRIDVVDAVTGCPPPSVRQLIVRSRRACSLRSVWFSGSSDDFALTYVLRGLLGDNVFEASLEDSVPHHQITASILLDNFITPLSTAISSYSDGSLSYTALRRLLAFPIPASSRRILLLWCLSKWRNFRPVSCQLCGDLFQSQDHIVECSDLSVKLLTDDLLLGLEISPSNPVKILEAYITAISDLFGTEYHGRISITAPRLVTHMCDAVRQIRGLTPLHEI